MATGKSDRLPVGLIGFGAIGWTVAEAIAAGQAGSTRLVSVLCRSPASHAAARRHDAVVTADRDQFLAARPRLVVEAAGHDALREHGAAVLRSGADLLATSIGAFANDEFFSSLAELARASGRRIILASGALPAVDWIQSAAIAGGCSAAVTQSKPVASWRGTYAEQLVDLDALTEPTCFFEASARETAERFPKSSNITAMLGLVGAGLQATTVRLVALPDGRPMQTIIEFSSAAGSLSVDWRGMPSDLNPKTSRDVPLNVIKTLRNLTGPVAYGS